MKGCLTGCMGFIAAVVVAGGLLIGGVAALIASTGIVVIPVLSGVLFRSQPLPGAGYVGPRDTADDRRDRIVEIGDELRGFFEYGIRPASGAFELSEQDIADILAELVVDLEEGAVLGSVAVDLSSDEVNAFLEVDAGAAARAAGITALAADRFVSFGVTTVDVKTNLRFVNGALTVDVQHIQVGRAPEFLGRLLAFVSEIPIDRSISRLPVETAIEELVVGEGKVELKFRGILE
jgi:hypothetical protein